MKNILVLTDFSADAKHAAEYAYLLSKKIEANLILFNAINLPAEVPQAGFLVWPMEECEVLQEDSTSELKKLKLHLEDIDNSENKKPRIDILNRYGYLQDVVNEVIAEQSIDLVIMGTHKGGLGGLMLGNHTRNMIDFLNVPILLIPLKVKITPFENIFFASDLSDLHGDSAFLQRIVPLARAFKAEIFISHISTPKHVDSDLPEETKAVMLEFNNDLGYQGIHFNKINGENEMAGLDKLMANSSMDLLVMVHRPKSFIKGLLKGSLSQKLAKELYFPMLIFKAKPKPEHIA